MSALGNLVVSLVAETAQFRSAMEKAAYQAQKSFNSIRRDADTVARALIGYFSTTMFVGWIKGAIDAADALYELSERTGIATDVLSKLQYAAKLSDVSTEEFSANLIKFNKTIAEAARSTGDAEKAFSAMGVSVKDASGNVKSADALLAEVADKFANYADGANKVALATALFGRSGASMIALLNGGAAGLAAMGKELERLGGVVMPDAARRANEFNDNLVRIKTSTSAVGLEIGNVLLPYLNQLANQFLLARKHGLNFLDMFSLGLTDPFFGNIQKEIRMLDEQYQRQVANGDKDSIVARSLKRQSAYLREIAQIEALAIADGDLSDQISRRMESEARAAAKVGQKQAPALPGEVKKPQVNDEVFRLLDRQALAVQKLTMSEEELAVAEIFLAGANAQQLESAQRMADVLTKERQEREKAKEQLDGALELYREWKTLYEETASPAQRLADEEARLLALRERLIEAGYVVADVERAIAEARMNAYDKLFPAQASDQLAQLRDIAQQFSAAIGTAFEDAVLGGENLRNVLKSLEQDLIRIGIRQLFTKPLEKAISEQTSSIFSSSGGGDLIGNIVSTIFGGKEEGGTVFPGRTYVVGERGPELFVPSMTAQAGDSAGVSTRAGTDRSLFVGESGPELFVVPKTGGIIIPNWQVNSLQRFVRQFARPVAGVRRGRSRDTIVDIAGVRERGGAVAPNKTYLVGEKGPELFVAPNTGWEIVPHAQLASFRKSINRVAESIADSNKEKSAATAVWPKLSGTRANGGLVSPGGTYLVGERGPEIFMPKSLSMGGVSTEPSTVVSNPSVTNININVSGVQSAEDLRRGAAQIASMAAVAVQRGRRNL